MTYRVVTSFGPGGWEQYARRMVTSFLEHWDAALCIDVYYHDTDFPADAPKDPRVRYVNLNDVSTEFVQFREKAHRGGEPYNYRLDAWKFSAKVFALIHATTFYLQLKDQPRLIWLDADTYTTEKVTPGWLNELCPDDADFVNLPRDAIPYSETSFVLFDLRRVPAQALLRDLYAVYVTGEIYNYKEWHDGFVFERLLFLHEAHGAKVVSLTPPGYAGLEAFENSPLGTKMVHLKGNRKNTPMSQFPTRYERLDALVKFYATGYKNYNILETGTWNGGRAIRLARAAFDAGVTEVHYDGYDLFEEADAASDEKELNTKPHNSLKDVTATLGRFAKDCETVGLTFSFSLHKGDTKQTLSRRTDVNFAYLDGGHSFETAQHDYRCVASPETVVVFDDYFVKDPVGRIPAPEHCGTNQVFDAIDAESDKSQKYVIPSMDPVKGGGVTCLALHVPFDFAMPPKDIMAPPVKLPTPLKVQARDCVPADHIIGNIKENLTLIDRWMPKFAPHLGTMVVVSGGPSVLKEADRIRKLVAEGAYVMAVKHALPYLAELGIVPDGLVLLDPRDVTGTSTHGIKRTTLFDTLSPKTAVFLASMSDPSVTKLLKKNTDNIWGWHAYTDSIKDYKGFPPGAYMVTGGTCAAWRSIPLGRLMGFDKFHLFGFDFCYDEADVDKDAKDGEGRNKYLRVAIGSKRKEFWSTGELIAAAQDAEQFFSRADDLNMEIYCYGDGIGPLLWQEILGKVVQRKQDFRSTMKWNPDERPDRT